MVMIAGFIGQNNFHVDYSAADRIALDAAHPVTLRFMKPRDTKMSKVSTTKRIKCKTVESSMAGTEHNANQISVMDTQRSTEILHYSRGFFFGRVCVGERGGGAMLVHYL